MAVNVLLIGFLQINSGDTILKSNWWMKKLLLTTMAYIQVGEPTLIGIYYFICWKNMQTGKLQSGLQNLQKKEEKVFLQSIATLGIAAVSIPLTQILEPFWSNWGYKQGYKKGLHDPNAEEWNFKTGFVIGLTDPAAKPDPTLVAVTRHEKSWGEEVASWLHRLK